MASINDLINQVENPELKAMLQAEVRKLNKQKKFGLVFENHMPECTPLYDLPIKAKSTVAKKDKVINETYTVAKIEGDILTCVKDKEVFTFNKNDMVCVAKFGEPIYPYLQPIDKVCNALDSNLWHTLIEADNYHALQLLEYLYAGKVDCIYIDPPYNTGAKDWKYNNNYVDKEDAYRHSKWLSMMEKRLRLAKKLLNPKDSVLIITIDEKEYHHLACLLEELFPEANIQMITDVINAKGVARLNQFSRVEEFIFFIQLGDSNPIALEDSMLDFEVTGDYKKKAGDGVPWGRMLRRGSNSHREHSENCFYPIFVDEANERIHSVGFPPGKGVNRYEKEVPEGCVAVWPMHNGDIEGCWQLSRNKFVQALEDGTAKLGRQNKLGQWSINYLNQGLLDEISEGSIVITGKDEKGAVLLERRADRKVAAKSVWNRKPHDASLYGSVLLSSIIGKRFSYPKSLYSEFDTLRFFTKNKPEALIIDFFAGSGTTLHAVNLINTVYGGNRRCILVTNNEVSADEAKNLSMKGYQPGDKDWDAFGIARYVAWPRTKCSILGVDVDGKTLNGEYFTTLKKEYRTARKITQVSFNSSLLSFDAKKSIVALMGKEALPQSLVKKDSQYIVSDKHKVSIIFNLDYFDEWSAELEENSQVTDIYIVTDNNKAFKKLKDEVQGLMGDVVTEEPVKLPMAEGFKSNVEYFKLGFLDPKLVSLGRKFNEILPIIWLKSGAFGPRPTLEDNNIPEMLIPENNNFAVLIDETYFAEFKEAVANNESIKDIYFVTNSQSAYVEMVSNFDGYNTYQLYKDYLDNFRINVAR